MFNFFLFLSLFFNFGCLGNLKNKLNDELPWESCSQEIGDHPCDFTFLDQTGKEVSLYDFYGSPILLDFSTGWCGFCKWAAMDVQRLQDSHASIGLVYITVLLETHNGKSVDVDYCDDWADEFDIYSAPILAGDYSIINENPAKGWDVQAYPIFFFIDEEMILRTQLTGFGPSEIENIIDSLFYE